jgi:hypothetical protein
MKNMKHILCVISVLAISISASGLAKGEEAYVPTETEEFYGTWVNPEYKPKASSGFSVKLVYNSDGRWEAYNFEDTSTPTWSGSYTIIDKWTDSEGSVWYKVAWETRGGSYGGKNLVKISNSGNTCEVAQSGTDYPTEIDPTHPNYRIRYRK